MKRRQPRLRERLMPCACCGYPVSQRHHLLPVHRYGDTNCTAQLCANCHEAYHIFEQGIIDLRTGNQRSHAARVMAELYFTWGGPEAPRVKYFYELIDRADRLKQAMIPCVPHPEDTMTAQRMTIRRGDTVRLSDGKIAQVVSTAEGYIHTTVGTYGPWQVLEVGRGVNHEPPQKEGSA